MVRIFVAIDLPDPLRRVLSEVQEPLRSISGRLAIVDPSLLHITLRFLGEVPLDRVPVIIAALRSVCFNPYEIDIRGISANNLDRPRVIWAEVEDGGETAALAEQIEDAISPLGFSREMRPFRSHITLARVKEFHPDHRYAILPLSSWCGGRIMVSQFVLKKSTLTPAGPIYETIAEVPL